MNCNIQRADQLIPVLRRLKAANRDTQRWFKCVRVQGEGQFRFVDPDLGDHKSLVDEGETAVDAATISVEESNGNYWWKVRDNYSSSLNVALSKKGYEKLRDELKTVGFSGEQFAYG